MPWESRLAELEEFEDPIERVLAEVEARARGSSLSIEDPSQLK